MAPIYLTESLTEQILKSVPGVNDKSRDTNEEKKFKKKNSKKENNPPQFHNKNIKKYIILKTFYNNILANFLFYLFSWSLLSKSITL